MNKVIFMDLLSDTHCGRRLKSGLLHFSGAETIMKAISKYLAAAWFTVLCTGPFAVAGEADVIDVKIEKKSADTYDFNVTVEHADEGWKHYADGWEVLDEQGTVVATRVLHHPHVNEQPFTRGLSAVKIPQGVSTITVRAHDSEHGHGGRTVTIDLP